MSSDFYVRMFYLLLETIEQSYPQSVLLCLDIMRRVEEIQQLVLKEPQLKAYLLRNVDSFSPQDLLNMQKLY